MSKKRTYAESINDEQKNEGSDSLFQQENNAKRPKLASLSETTLHDLPMELLDFILVKVVALEVKGMKLAKSVWKEKAGLVMSRLRTVCSQWCNILTTKFFRNEVNRALDGTAEETIHLEILHQYTIPFYVFTVTTTKDEMFMICKEDNIIVYNRNTMTETKDAIALQGTLPWDIAACSVSNCVYVLGLRMKSFSMLRITKDEEHQFNISQWINDLTLPVSARTCISVSANGSLIILSWRQGQIPAGISIYDANGYLQHRILLSPGILRFTCRDNVVEKSNGNLVMVSTNDQFKRELTEIDATGRIERQYKSSIGVGNGVNFADIYGRFVITEADNKIKLLDSELNPLDLDGPHLNADHLHYSSERNEVVGTLSIGPDISILTIFRFTEE